MGPLLFLGFMMDSNEYFGLRDLYQVAYCKND